MKIVLNGGPKYSKLIYEKGLASNLFFAILIHKLLCSLCVVTAQSGNLSLYSSHICITVAIIYTRGGINVAIIIVLLDHPSIEQNSLAAS
jgi:hypothetical protein